MKVFITFCFIVTACILALFVIRGLIQTCRRIIRYTAEEKIEELQEQHQQELDKKDRQIKLLEYCCSHPRINVEVWKPDCKQEEST